MTHTLAITMSLLKHLVDLCIMNLLNFKTLNVHII